LSLSLGVLDQSPIPAGSSVGDALRNSIDLAKLTDSLGYHRYWLAEHHGAASLACASPEAMIGPIAAATRSLRVGSGGIMLPHYSPLKVAETFSMLNGLYDGRIDLGIGRAPESPGRSSVTAALRRRTIFSISSKSFSRTLPTTARRFQYRSRSRNSGSSVRRNKARFGQRSADFGTRLPTSSIPRGLLSPHGTGTGSWLQQTFRPRRQR